MDFFLRTQPLTALILVASVVIVIGYTLYTYLVVNRDVDDIVEQATKKPIKCPACGELSSQTIGVMRVSWQWRVVLKTKNRWFLLYGLRCVKCGYVSIFSNPR